jgi:transcriptional regulator with XRE-family HTH domain
MTERFDAGELLAAARRRAGLTQRELARRAGTSQSVIARVEAGTTSPGSATLERLIAATGYELRAHLVVGPVADTHMLEDVARILSLTPEQRLLEVRNVSRLLASARRV